MTTENVTASDHWEAARKFMDEMNARQEERLRLRSELDAEMADLGIDETAKHKHPPKRNPWSGRWT